MKSKVPFNSLLLQWNEIADAAQPEIDQLFAESAFSGGPYVERFEKEIANWLGSPHAIACNSGTSALHLAMLAADIKQGDEVLVPAHTFIATIWGVLYVGATPVLCDVDAATGTIDLSDAARRVTSRTRAIIPVHLYGQPADLAAASSLAAKHGLQVIEDNAQAIGAKFDGRQLGTRGKLGCFSFYPGKNLGGAGEGGLVTTADDQLASRMRTLRNHGQSERYIHGEVGYNYRMDGIQAVVLRHKLARLAGWTAERQRLARGYAEKLKDLPLQLPQVVNQDHVWHLYVVRTAQRDALRNHLSSEGIETGMHYPVPIHKQPCMQELGFGAGSFPQSEAWANEGLSLPLFMGMTDDQLDLTVGAIRRFFKA